MRAATYRDLAWRIGRGIDSTWHSVQVLRRKGLIREARCGECGGKRWEVVE